jgi:hypothetical protein
MTGILIRLRTGVKEPNEDVREKELSRSPGCGAGDSIRTHYPLCLKKLVRTLTPALGLRYRLTLTLCQPNLCPISGVRMHCSNQVLAVVWSLFRPYLMDTEAVLHLRKFFVLRVR